jgi:hypothetical protein
MIRISLESPALIAVRNWLAGSQPTQRGRNGNRKASRPSFRLEHLEGRTMLDAGMRAFLPDLAAESDTGWSNVDNLTSDQTPTLTGRVSSAASQARLIIDGRRVAEVPVVNGMWSYTVPAEATLAAGGHTIAARAVDASGKVGRLSKPLAVKIVTTVPNAPTLRLGNASDTGTKGDGITTYATPTFRGIAEPGKIVNVSIDGVSAGRVLSHVRTGEWLFKSPKLSNGKHHVTVEVENSAGLKSAATDLAVDINGQRTVILDASNGPVELKASHILGGGSQGFIVTKVHDGTLEKWSATRNSWKKIPTKAFATNPAAVQIAPAIRTISYTDLVRWTPSSTTRGIGQAFNAIPLDKSGGLTEPTPGAGTVPGKVVNLRSKPVQGNGSILTWNALTDGYGGSSTRYSVEVTREDGQTLLYNVPSTVRTVASVEGGTVLQARIWGATNTGAGEVGIYNPVPVNLPPTIAPVENKTLVNGQIVGTVGAIDPEGDPLTFVLTQIPKYGTVQINPDGTYVYTPGMDYPGYDSFWLAVNDGEFNGEALVSVGDPSLMDLNSALISRGLTIYNLTGSNLELTDFYAERRVENRATVGTVLKPAESTFVRLAQYAFETNRSTSTFSRQTNAFWSGFLTYFDLLPVATNWGCKPVYAPQPPYFRTEGSTTNRNAALYLLDPDGTTITIPSGQGQEQADLLNQLAQSKWVNSSFTPKSFDDTVWTDWKLAANPVLNNTPSPLTTTITATVTQSTTTTLKLSASIKAKVFEVVEITVAAEYSEAWTDTYTFSQSVGVTAQPGEKVFLETREPVKRVIGDYTVQMGNTTWILKDVYFDSPDPDRYMEYKATTTQI